jgi:hypothetical protein
MIRFPLKCAAVLAMVFASGPAPAADNAHQHGAMDHGAMMAAEMASAGPAEGGQGAFAAIAEIVALLMVDPATDWQKVDIEGLRQHLIDMEEVTLRSEVTAHPVPGGMGFSVTGTGRTLRAIHAMVPAHAGFMDGRDGWRWRAMVTKDGAMLSVFGATPADEARIAGLGFIGVMALGNHHPAHHLALAKGEMTH